jgi:hypothetical protein
MEYPLTRNYLQQMSRDELRELCRKKKYRVTGFKCELANRVLGGDHQHKANQTSVPRPKLIKPIIDTMMTLSPPLNRKAETSKDNIKYYLISILLIIGMILIISCSY